jgi:hypothetical protein
MAINVLRYPYEAITDKTDYLQITIKQYNPARTGLIRSGSPNATAINVGNPSTLYSQTLAPDGVILLPMPSNIQDSNSVSYSDDSLDSLTARLVSGAGGLMDTDFTKGGGSAGFSKAIEDLGIKAGKLAKSFLDDPATKDVIMKNLAAQAAGVFGGNVTLNQLLARTGGQILNPNMELLFNGVTLRTFRFSFKMTPRDSKESEQVKLIIRSLKKNMAAKPDGTFLKSPNIFDLVYRQGPGDHKFLHKFKPAALTDMSVNYTGENVYATYHDGTPISISMDLTFKELVPIYENDYDPVAEGVGF